MTIPTLANVFKLPQDGGAFAAAWWTAPQAAASWGVTYDTARRRILMDPARSGAVMVPVQSKRGKAPIFRLCVPVGTQLPELLCKGNPHFQDPDWQRRNVRRRWGEDPEIQQPPKYHGNDRSINLDQRTENS